VGYAETPHEAEHLVARFNESYSKQPAPAGGAFHLITTGREISTEMVSLGAETILEDESFLLHYGNESRQWHQDFTDTICASNHGLSIFEGTPGTGKTSYLRHLMGVLKKSHRFYFIPPATMGVLSTPEFIGFWANQRRRHADRKFVVILEDSDAALMTRGVENREQVSAILNLSDGMLADFLRLHVICTINCRAADIDQALLRPGRQTRLRASLPPCREPRQATVCCARLFARGGLCGK
jgi:SpoVK/Ycf46/Vps4 family AAA+-type ATPase